MKQKEALESLYKKNKFIDEDVKEIIISDVVSEIEKREEELSKKIIQLKDLGITQETIKNIILSKYNSGIWFKYT
ncbi:hypothetical protein [Aquimarina algiphila]|uniref:Uncharacterized protein n=1 Tax=Aquimarina algiphila TaxID=2047982 RepID=A0A554VF99_9FLAO|nr:hypothetical protein [Aquimarina algiphila]TSE05828.1 hypothetical protein FOF46_21565 [Aquimarina algiphila]